MDRVNAPWFALDGQGRPEPRTNVFESLWFAAVLCAVVFFVCNHHLSEPLRVDADVDVAATAIEDGSLARQVSLTALGAYGLVLLFRARPKSPTRPPAGVLGFLVFAFLAWACMSVAWTEAPAFALRKVAALLMLGLGAWGIARRFSPREVAGLVAITSFGYLVFGLALELADGTFTPLDVAYRFGGTLHPNHQAMNCGLLSLACFYLVKEHARLRRMLAGIAVVALAFLLLTKSRTGLASTLAALAAYWLLVSSRIGKVAAVTGALAATAVAAALYLGGAVTVSEDALLLGRTDAEMETLSGRTDLWDWTTDLLKDRELTGYGFNSFWTPDRVEEISEEQHWTISQGHSTYLDMLLGVGIVGLALYVALLLAGAGKAMRLEHDHRDGRYAFLCAVIVFALVEGTAESALLQSTVPAFLTIAAIGMLTRPGERIRAPGAATSPRPPVVKAPWNALGARPAARSFHSR